MKCFYHAEADAIGLCKFCQRGLCHACAEQRPSGLACRGEHAARVDAIDTLIDRNVKLSSGAQRMSLLALIVYFGSAAVFAYLGFNEPHPTLRILMVVMSALMLYLGIAHSRLLLLRRARGSSGER